MKYRIFWKAVATGKTGYGQGLFSQEEAQRIADGLNIQDKGILFHWIQLVGEANESD